MKTLKTASVGSNFTGSYKECMQEGKKMLHVLTIAMICLLASSFTDNFNVFGGL